ncbi:MAG: hypothetical protein ABI823_05840 [Bryobacteraceae bacterium]
MGSPFANLRPLADSLAAESAKLEAALDEHIGKLGGRKNAAAPERPTPMMRLRKATVLLFWIALVLGALMAFAFGFLAGFH